jgi:hypothetical protein
MATIAQKRKLIKRIGADKKIIDGHPEAHAPRHADGHVGPCRCMKTPARLMTSSSPLQDDA